MSTAYRTFTQERGITARGLFEAQEAARREAAEYIDQQLGSQEVLSISETSLILPLSSKGMHTVTVWYRQR